MTLINTEPIIDEQLIDKIDKIIDSKEVQLFDTKTYYDD